MRITQNSMNRTQMAGLNGSLGRLQRTQEQLTTGKRLVRPSDDPVSTVSAMRLRDQQRSLTALGDSIKDGTARLQAADDALGRSQTMLTKIRTLVVAGANGVNGPDQQKAYAQEADQIRQGLVQLANTNYAGQPVFGGTTVEDNAFDPATGKFIGNDTPVLRKVTEAEGAAGDMNVGVSGGSFFRDPSEPAGTPVAELTKPGILEATGDPKDTGLLDRVVQHLRDGDQAALQQDLVDLDLAQTNLSEASSIVGARSNRLAQLDTQNMALADGATEALSKVEDTDFMKAAMDLSVQSNAYNAALQASAKIIQPSLMDFLR